MSGAGFADPGSALFLIRHELRLGWRRSGLAGGEGKPTGRTRTRRIIGWSVFLTLVGLYDVFTRESVRGQGLAGLLCERLLSLASNDGAQVAYLQVESGNEAALRVYAKLGFVDGYTYHYREPPAP